MDFSGRFSSCALTEFLTIASPQRSSPNQFFYHYEGLKSYKMLVKPIKVARKSVKWSEGIGPTICTACDVFLWVSRLFLAFSDTKKRSANRFVHQYNTKCVIGQFQRVLRYLGPVGLSNEFFIHILQFAISWRTLRAWRWQAFGMNV